MKKEALALLCVGLLVLSGCGKKKDDSGETVLSLPAPSVRETAPKGDEGLSTTAAITLLEPNLAGTNLMAVTKEIDITLGQCRAVPILEALLEDSGITPALTLLGAEVSKGVATVNLGYTASLLSKRELYLLCQSICDTLCTNLDLDGVNVLLAGRAIGLDTRDSFPVGTFTPSANGELSGLWNRASAVLSESDTDQEKSFDAVVTLYYPAEGLAGILPELQRITFPSSAPAAVAQTLLSRLSMGSTQNNVPVLPDFASLLTQAPSVEEHPASARRTLVLHFDNGLNEQLALARVTRSAFVASLVYTMTTFLPQITYVQVWIGEEQIQSVTPASPYFSDTPIVFDGGEMRRSDFELLLMDDATLYFAGDEGLVGVTRPVPWKNKSDPRFLLQQLALGNKNYDSKTGLGAVLSQSYQDSDLLGVSGMEDTLVLNFNHSFTDYANGSAGEERLIYALMNTLLPAAGVKKGCIFIEGTQPETIQGALYWQGYFRENYGIVATE